SWRRRRFRPDVVACWSAWRAQQEELYESIGIRQRGRRRLPLHHLVRHILGNSVALQTLGASLASISAVLDAAEGRLGDRGDKMVDRKIADLNAVGESIRIGGRAREGVACQAVWQGIGLFDRFIEGLHGIDQREWPERLLVHGASIIGQVGQNRQGEEI